MFSGYLGIKPKTVWHNPNRQGNPVSVSTFTFRYLDEGPIRREKNRSLNILEKWNCVNVAVSLHDNPQSKNLWSVPFRHRKATQESKRTGPARRTSSGEYQEKVVYVKWGLQDTTCGHRCWKIFKRRGGKFVTEDTATLQGEEIRRREARTPESERLDGEGELGKWERKAVINRELGAVVQKKKEFDTRQFSFVNRWYSTGTYYLLRCTRSRYFNRRERLGIWLNILYI